MPSHYNPFLLARGFLFRQAPSRRASRALADFSRLIESVAGYDVSDLSTALGRMQLDIAKESKRMSYVTVWLTIVVLLLMIVQVYVAVKLSQPPINSTPTQHVDQQVK